MPHIVVCVMFCPRLQACTIHVSPHVLGCSASSWTPPLLISESISLPCSDVYHGFNPGANVTWTCNGEPSLVFGIWNCTFRETVTIAELAFSEHTVNLEGLNETRAQLQSQVCGTNKHSVFNGINFNYANQHLVGMEPMHILCGCGA